jgi:hypothetical protein
LGDIGKSNEPSMEKPDLGKTYLPQKDTPERDKNNDDFSLPHNYVSRDNDDPSS